MTAFPAMAGLGSSIIPILSTFVSHKCPVNKYLTDEPFRRQNQPERRVILSENRKSFFPACFTNQKTVMTWSSAQLFITIFMPANRC